MNLNKLKNELRKLSNDMVWDEHHNAKKISC